MVRRLFWMAVGASAAVWAVNRTNAAVHRLTPDGLSGTAARGVLQLGDAAQQFAATVRAGMAEREEQLRADLGLDGTAVMDPPRGALRREPGHRAVSAAPPPPPPGSPAAALPPSRRTRTQATALTPRQLRKLSGRTPDRKDH